MAPPTLTSFRTRWTRLLRHRTFMIGGVLLSLVIVITALGPLLYGGDPLTTNPLFILQGPSEGFPLGTDQLGRDVLARVLHAGLLSIPLGMLAITGGAIVGTAIGLTAGFL